MNKLKTAVGEAAIMLHYRWIYRPVLLLATSLSLMTLNACSPSGGAFGIDWGEGSPPPSHHSYDRHQGKKKGPPPHAPAHGYRAKYHYRYYPDACVYYDTARHVYFYIEKGGWRMSVSLPGFIRLGSSYVTLEMDTDKPYRHHHEHKVKYPPGKMKNKSKKKKWNKS